jgi:hypothetical protein
MDLVLQTRTQPDQLGPMPHPTAQLPGRGRGDPGLGQSAHPQQISQVRGVALIFTRRKENIFTPNGCARCTLAPSAARVSAAQ